jgi:hypothetical protein
MLNLRKVEEGYRRFSSTACKIGLYQTAIMHHQRLPVYHLSLFADRADGYVDAGFYQKPEPDGQGCFWCGR